MLSEFLLLILNPLSNIEILFQGNLRKKDTFDVKSNNILGFINQMIFMYEYKTDLK